MKAHRKFALAVPLLFVSSILSAAPLTWDPSATLGTSPGGNGNWDTSSAFWFNTNNATDVAWVNANNDDAIFSGAASTVTLTQNINAGDLYFTNLTGSVVIANATGVETLTLANGIVDTGGTTDTISALLTGSSLLTKNGDGTLVLSGSNTGHTGPVQVNQGTLETTTASSLGTGTITVTNGGTVEFTAAGTIANPYFIGGAGVGGAGALLATASQTFNGAIISETNVVIGTASGTTFDMEGGYTNAGSVNANLVLGGGGNYKISNSSTTKGVNLHAGSITLNSGDLNIESTSLTYSNLVINGGQYSSALSDNSFGTKPNVFNASNITISNGANVLLSHTFTINSTRGIFLGAGGGDLGANSSGATITIPGAISGPGSLLFETDGPNANWKLQGNNTFTGTLTVQAGVPLAIGGGGGSGTFGKGDTIDNGSITVSRTGTLTYSGAISGSGNLTLQPAASAIITMSGPISSSGNLVLQPAASAIVTVSGPISSSGSVSLSGLGTVILSGANSFTANVTDQAQYLLVNNTSGSGTGTGNLTVNAGSGNSFLGGTGIISGPVTVAAGNTLQPGNAVTNTIGTLTINNSLTLQPASFSSMTIKAGANSAVMGMTSITFGGTLTVNLLSTPVAGQTYQLFGASSYSGTFESGVVLPSLPTGLTWNTSNLYVNGSISVVGSTGTVFNPPVISGGNLILSGTGGTPNGSYNVLSTTNLALPVANWTVLSTGNTFDSSGNFNFTTPFDPTSPQEYFLIQ